jgi:hypothetical protein
MASTSSVASFTYNSVTFVAVGSCAISSQRPVIDVTYLGSWNSYSLPGVMATAITLDVFISMTDHVVLVTNLVNGEVVRAFTVTLVTGDTITGSAYVTGFDSAIVSGDVSRASFTLVVDGAITMDGDLATKGTSEP